MEAVYCPIIFIITFLVVFVISNKFPNILPYEKSEARAINNRVSFSIIVAMIVVLLCMIIYIYFYKLRL